MVPTKDIMSKIQLNHFQLLTVSLLGRPINKEEFCTVAIPLCTVAKNQHLAILAKSTFGQLFQYFTF